MCDPRVNQRSALPTIKNSKHWRLEPAITPKMIGMSFSAEVNTQQQLNPSCSCSVMLFLFVGYIRATVS